MKLYAHRIVLACVLCGGGLLSVGLALDGEAGDANPLPSSNEVKESFPTLDFEAAKLELDATPMPFADWALVEAGNLDWVGPDGEKLPLNDPHGLSSPDEARAVPFCLASGVSIKTQAAEKSGLFSDMLPREYPWEQGTLKANTLLLDKGAGLYRVWYDCPGGLAYAESSDLIAWRKPLLNPNAYGDQQASNLAYIANRDACATSGMFQKPESLEVAQSGSVLRDPSAPPEERYKTTILASAAPDRLWAFAEAKGKPLSSRVSPNSGNVLFPAVSADGVAWRVIPEPNLLHDADTQTVVAYDARIKRYVLYTRVWEFGRRAIARAESADFRDFPLPRTVLAPDAAEPPYVDYYANAMAVYPGRSDLQLMFVLAYDRRVESSVIRTASSRDGVLWQFTPGAPALRPGEAGAWDRHFVVAVPSFVRTPDGGMLLLYNAYNLPHKFPRHGFVEANQGIARWKADRLFALEAEEEGWFTTPLLRLRGTKLLLNAQTTRTGEIRVEVRDREFKPVSGRTFAEADPFTGDDTNVVATWNGESELGALRDEFVYLRFQMRSAKLFALRAE